MYSSSIVFRSPFKAKPDQSSQHQVDRLFVPHETTEAIYSELLHGLISFAKQGGIATLFAYGKTGSGKTFTIQGLQRLVASSLLGGDEEKPSDIKITVIDLAGNSAFDLLTGRIPVAVLEDADGNIHLKGAEERTIASETAMLDLLECAALYRKTASTLKNDASSRSHCICRLCIPPSTTDAPPGYLYMVDLAGSEAARDIAEHGADRMRETREINMSLSVLKNCIRGKAEADKRRQNPSTGVKQQPRIPSRQSTLTRVLRHVFEPEGRNESKTVVLACINPSLADVGPSKNTLRYTAMLRGKGPQ